MDNKNVSSPKEYFGNKGKKRVYQIFFEVSPVAFACMDPGGSFVEANRAFEKLLGYSRDELLKLRYPDILSQDYRLTAFEDIRELREYGAGSENIGKKIVRKNGECVPVNLSTCACTDGQGNPLYFLIANKAPRQRSAWPQSAGGDNDILQAVFDQSFHLIGLLNAQGVVLKVNSTILDYLKVNEEALVGRLMWETPGWSYSSLAQESIQAAVEKAARGEFVRFEIHHLAGEHRLQRLDLMFKPMRERDGKVASILCDGRIMDENVPSDTALQRNEHLLLDIINFTPDPTMVINNQGVVIAWNNALEEMSAVAARDMIGKGNYEYSLPFCGARQPMLIDMVLLDRDELQRQCPECRWIGNTLVSETFVPELRGGRGAYLWNTARVLRDAQGKVIGAIESMRDISGRKHAEEETIKLKLQLAHAQKMEALGTLAGGIAHDFNNILCSVLGNTDIALLKLLEHEPVENELDEIMQAGLRARELVDQILTFSRQTEIIKKPIDITPIVKETIKFMRATLPAFIDIHEDLQCSGKVLVNPTQIHQIVMNLTTNAAHAMRESGGELKIQLQETLLGAEDLRHHDEITPGRYVQLSITDTGCGMSQEVLEKIFDPFFTTKKRGEGTGIGLSVVLGIVKDMQGHINVTSKPGQGSTFYIWLPVCAANGGEPEIPRNILKGGLQRILLVDDDPAVVSSVHAVLELYGYDVVCALSPVEALRIFQAGPETFSLVLTDYIMPGMNGILLAQKIREIRFDIPILLYTGYSNDLGVDELRTLDITLVMKPLLASELAEIIFNKIHGDGR